MNKRDKIYSISGFEAFNLNPGKKFCKANDELLLVCGSNNIFLVDYLAHQLINKIECEGIIGLYKLSNNFIFSGENNGDIKQWKCNGKNTKLYSYKKAAHNSYSMIIFRLNNIFISGDDIGYIKIWELK